MPDETTLLQLQALTSDCDYLRDFFGRSGIFCTARFVPHHTNRVRAMREIVVPLLLQFDRRNYHS